MSKKGRDPVFKCSICGKFIAYEDIDTDKVKRNLGNTIDTMLETVEFYHTKCENNQTQKGDIMGLFIKIINDGTGSTSYGDYNYEVSVNGKIIETGKITNYPRPKGAGQLIKLVGMDVDQKSFEKALRLREESRQV